MAQNVGPILEMVTEKYLLRSAEEWTARHDAISLLNDIVAALKAGDIPSVGKATHRNFFEPLQKIIPWCSNAYTETLVKNCEDRYGKDFHGFWMLGGKAGGGMGFIFEPSVREEAQDWLQEMMLQVKESMQESVPFAMDPVVYDFTINDRGTWCELRIDGIMPAGYSELVIPDLLKEDLNTLSPMRRKDLERAGDRCRQGTDETNLAMRLINRILPGSVAENNDGVSIDSLLNENGFDKESHETVREEIKSGRLGLAQNRLASTVTIEDVLSDDVVDVRFGMTEPITDLGTQALKEGRVAVITLSAGVGSRWTQGAGVVKALNPFCRMSGRFRSFLDVHLAKSRQTAQKYGIAPAHVVTTGYLTDSPIRRYVQQHAGAKNVYVSRGASVGLRMVPTIRDLQFAWEEMPQQTLDEQQEKMRISVRAALMNWAESTGEATDYTDNLPLQCLHPVGHWYEVPNLLLNGTLHKMLQDQPRLQYLMLHNIDTLGANLDAACLGQHIAGDSDLTYEVISRRLEDRGGGLARVDGHVRLMEGLAMPREKDEFNLSYYNSLTTWITIDRLLKIFGLTRDDLSDRSRIEPAVRKVANRMPTYVTLKDVKKRWGRGQEDVFPVSQFEKLWGDMTALGDVDCQFLVVPTQRGQQLKDPAQLDGWLRDGSASHIESLVTWDS